jgi:hypothetical protein
MEPIARGGARVLTLIHHMGEGALAMRRIAVKNKPAT